MFKSVIDMDRSPIVLCDLNHIIVYMNPSALRKYKNRGGNLTGKSLLDCHNNNSCEIIEKVVKWFKEDKSNNMIYTFRNKNENKDVYMVALRDEEQNLIGYYEKHEYRNQETADVYDFSESLI